MSKQDKYYRASSYCSITAQDFEKSGKSVIYSTEAQTHYQYWWSFNTVRDGITGTKGNDIIHLGYKDDSLVADLGNDFIVVENENIAVYGDLWPISQEGGNDTIVIRNNKNIYVEGQRGSDEYYIDILPKFMKESGYIVIKEIPSKVDKNIIHLCKINSDSNYEYKDLDIKKSMQGDLLIYINYYNDIDNNKLTYQTQIAIQNFCQNNNSQEKLLHSLIDYNSNNTILFDEVNCNDLSI